VFSTIELQTKIGDCSLDRWGIGSATTLPVGVYMDSFTCPECAEEPVPDKDLIEDAVSGRTRGGEIKDGGVLYRYKFEHWIWHVKVTVVKGHVLKSIERMKTCPGCLGHGYVNFREMSEFLDKGGDWRNSPARIDCDKCGGDGWLDQIVEDLC